MVLVARTARWCRLEDWAGEGTSSGVIGVSGHGPGGRPLH